MAETRTLARPYAQAVFEIARAGDALPAWSDALAAVSAIVSNDDVARLMGNPVIGATQLADAVIEIAGSDLPEQGANFVRLLAENGRLKLAPVIAEQFEALRAQAEQRVDVTVISAAEFSEQQKQALSQALEKRLAANVRLSFEHDPEVIGGAIIRAGDLVIDRSLRSQLTRMQYSLVH